MNRSLLNILLAMLFCYASTGTVAQIGNAWPGGCPITDTVGLDEDCLSVFDPSNIEASFSPGSGGTLTFTYNGDQPGQMINGGHGSMIETMLTVYEVDNDGMRIDSLDCEITVHYLDLSPPDISCPDDQVRTGSCQIINGLAPSVTENCDQSYTFFYDISFAAGSGFANVSNEEGSADGHVFPVGLSTVTYTFPPDNHGNQPDPATCAIQVQINGPAQPPIITDCPDDRTVNADPGACGADLVLSEVVAMDDCSGIDGLQITNNVNQGGADASGFYPVGKKTIVFTATNTNTGLSSTCTTEIVVKDREAPDASGCPGPIHLELSSGNGINILSGAPFLSDLERTGCQVMTDLILPSFMDNCDMLPHVTYEIEQDQDLIRSGIIDDDQDPDGNYAFSPGTYMIRYKTRDEALNQSHCHFTIQLDDNTAPQIQCPAVSSTYSADATACEKQFNAGELMPIVSDNCSTGPVMHRITPDNGMVLTGTGDPGIQEVFSPGSYTIVYKVSDPYGNSDSCTISFQVVDDLAPVFDCQDDVSTGPEAGEDFGLVNIPPNVMDNCQVVAQTYNIVFPTGAIVNGSGDASDVEFPIGTSNVMYTAIDPEDNIESCQFEVTVTPIAPDCPFVFDSAYLNASCFSSIDPSDVTADLFTYVPDASLDVVVSFLGNGTYTPFPTSNDPDPDTQNFGLINGVNIVTNPGLYTVDYAVQVFDDQGMLVASTNPCVVEFPVFDTIPPGLTCPGDQTIALNDELGSPGQCPVIPAELGIDLSASASDACSSPAVSYEIIDSTGFVYATGQGSAGFAAYDPGVNTITYTATDDSENTRTCSFTVEVLLEENTPPVLTCPDPLEIMLDGPCDTILANGEMAVEIMDNCVSAGSVTAEYEIEAPDGSISGPFAGHDASNGNHTFGLGSYLIRYSATDANGNTGSCEAEVMIIDASPAMLSSDCSVYDTVIYLGNGQCDYTLSGFPAPSAIDNCPGAFVQYRISGDIQASGMGSVNGQVLSAGQYSIFYEAVSGDGQIGDFCSFEVLIEDTIPPLLTCPANVTETAGPNCGNAVFGLAPQTSDACGILETTYLILFSDGTQGSGTGDPSGTIFPEGSSTLIFSARDSAGNESANCSMTVRLNDVTPPVDIQCPSDTTVTTMAGACETFVSLPLAQATDNCVSVPLFQNTWNLQGANASDFYPLGTTMVTFTISDNSGNSGNCVTNITVEPPADPQTLCPADVIVSTDPGICEATVYGISPAAVCQQLSVEYEIQFSIGGMTQGEEDASGVVFPQGTSTLTYSFLNENEEVQSTCSVAIEVMDTEVPEILFCPEPVTVSAGGGCSADVMISPVQVTDNCSIQSVENNQTSDGLDASSVYPVGTTIVLFTVMDDSGNINTCEVPVTVDDPALTLTCPDDVTVNADDDFCTALVNGIDPLVAGTACMDPMVAWQWESATDTLRGDSTLSGTRFPAGIHTVHYYIGDIDTDPTCTFSIQVDGALQLPACPEDTTVVADPGTCNARIFGLEPETDSCDIELFFEVSGASTYPLQPGSPDGFLFSLGMSNITFYYTDPFSDTLTLLCNREVIVLDEEDPVIECLDDVVIRTNGQQVLLLSGPDPGIGNVNDSCEVQLTAINAQVSDNCGVDVLSYFIELPDGSIINSPSTGINNASGFFFPVGVSQVNYFVADAAGNSATCNFSVEIIDAGVPSFQECVDYEVVNGVITQAPGGVFLQSNNACRPIFGGTSPVVTNDCGDIVRLDVEITGATNGVAINTGQPNMSMITGAMIGHTQPDGINSLDGVTFNVGTSEVEYTVFDSYGNMQTCLFTVVVVEFTAPSFVTCPDDITLGTDQGACTRQFTAAPPVFSENCGLPGSTLLYQIEIPAFSGNIMASGAGSVSYNFPVGEARVIYKLFDASGNQASNTCTYLITVEDSEKPGLTCPAPPVFSINSNTDPCEIAVPNIDAMVSDNCDAQPDLTYRITYPDGSQSGIQSGSASNRLFPTGSSMVTYTASDDSGNSRTCSFTVQVEDEAPPVIESCPDDLLMNADSNCQAIVNMPSISVMAGQCGTGTNEDRASHYEAGAGAVIASDTPGSTDLLVNPVSLSIDVPGPPSFASGSVQLDIYLYNIDAANNDGSPDQEFFLVYGEDSTLLGTTQTTLSDCDGQQPLVHPFYQNASIQSSIPISVAQLNSWAADGIVELRLEPNVPMDGNGDPISPEFGINDICGESKAVARLRYERQEPANGLDFFYRKNGEPLLTGIPARDTFLTGLHSVTYLVEDGAGNRDSCSFTIEILDNTTPGFEACPPDGFPLQYLISACDTLIELPFHGNVVENCSGTAQFRDTVTSLMSFGNDDVVDTILFQILGVSVNVAGDANLTVRVQGDVDDPNEYFSVFGEAGIFLGETATGDCSTPGSVSFTIPQSQMNDWAEDGIMEVSLLPFDAMAGPDPGMDGDPDRNTINNHCPGVSMGPKQVEVVLSYPSFPPVSYEVSGAVEVNKQLFPQDGRPEVLFPIGDSEVTYSVSDSSGNIGACTFTVSVRDSVPPELDCIQATTLFVNPSGLMPDTLHLDDVVLSVSDNCGLASVVLSDSIFDCTLAGGPLQMIEAIATDSSGNETTCPVNIRVETELIEPGYSVGICGNDTLYLYADTTIIPSGMGGLFTYHWTGPAGFESNVANPIIPQATVMNAGTYTLTMTGVNGCASEGTVFVSIDAQPNTPNISSPDTDICDNEEVFLQTQTYSGTSVTYFWYEGPSSNGVLIDSTNTPSYTIGLLSEGTYLYYVIVEVDGCASNASANIEIEVTASPEASTDNDLIDICEGENIILGTPNIDPFYDYLWTGPNGFASTLPNPQAITDATILDAGVYRLEITDGDCMSDPDSTVVTVRPKPEKPEISSNSPVCVGDSLILYTDDANADAYYWISDNFIRDTTTVPELLITGLSPGTREWRVRVEKNGCISEYSEWLEVKVETFPIANAGNNGPLCPGDPLQLFVNVVSGASYNWTGPGGFSSSTPEPVINAVAGTYLVQVTSAGGCRVIDSTQVVILDPPQIIDVLDDAPNCVTGNEMVTLGVETDPDDGGSFTYFWQGPAGFTSIDASPVIPNINSSLNGTYSVVVTDGNGCTSQPQSVVIDVTDTPAKPEIDPTDPICEGDQLTLSATDINNPNANYFWVLPSGDTLSSASATLNIPSASPGNNGNYQVYIELNGCISPVSDPEFVEVNPIPDMPQIMGAESVCEGSNLELQADFVNNANYQWAGPGSFISTVQNPVISNIQLDQGGTYSLIIEVDGCLSEMDTLDVTIIPKPPAPQLTNTGPACEGKVINLTASIGNLDAYIWTSPTFKEYQTPFNSFTLIPSVIEEGNWTVRIESDGCLSDASDPTFVDIIPTPPTPRLEVDTQFCVGDSILLSTDSSMNPTAQYSWVTPRGQFNSMVPELVITGAGLGDSGEYGVIVREDGCPSDTSVLENVTVFSNPSSPVVVTNSPVCEGETINLNTNDVPGATYQWTGPNGFTSGIPNPSLPGTQDYSGVYTLIISVNGCSSQPTSSFVNVIVAENPPSAQAKGPVCVDNPQAEIELSITPGTEIPGATYRWFNADTDTLVAGPTSNTMVTLDNVADFGSGMFSFYVVATVQDCSTNPSVPVQLEIQETPDEEAFAGNDQQLCGVNSTTLSAALPPVGFSGSWVQTCGPTVSIGNPNAPTTSVSGLQSNMTYCFTWTLDFESCGTNSDEVVVSIFDVNENADAGSDQELCNVSEAFLNAGSPSQSASGRWSQPGGQTALGVEIVSPNNEETLVTGLIPGNNFFFIWTLRNAGCGTFSRDTVEIYVAEADVNQADCGEDFVACGDGSIVLECIEPSDGTGFWTALSPGVDIVTPDRPNTIALGLETGLNLFIWTLSNDACGVFSADTIAVEYERVSIPNPDVAEVEFARDVEIDVLDNDLIRGDFLMEIDVDPAFGTAEVTVDDQILYTVNPGYAGQDEFFYNLCSMTCPDVCERAKVSINVVNTGCEPPTIITPNNDGVNDAFMIPCVASGEFPQTEVVIFNQWGDEIFREVPYQNNWQGTYKGEDVPDGTYYYIIKYGNDQPPQSGFLVIQR